MINATKLRLINKRIDREIKNLGTSLNSLAIVSAAVSVIFTMIIIPIFSLIGIGSFYELLLIFIFAMPSIYVVLWAMGSMEIIKLRRELYNEARGSL